MSHRLLTAAMVLPAAILLIGAGEKTDFDLPLLHKVPKVISVSDDIQDKQLARFAEVKDLTIEIRLQKGNMLPGFLFSALKDNFAKTPKRLVFGGNLKPANVEMLRKLDQLEVIYQIPPEGMDKKTIDALYSLGPVHKTLILPPGFGTDLFDQVKKFKFSEPAFRVDPGNFFTDVQLASLTGEHKHRQLAIVPAGIEPQQLSALAKISSLSLELQTVKNRIPDQLIDVLKNLKGVEITLVVDGRITTDDAKQWTQLERFALKVVVDDPEQVTPGLGQLLNRIAPP